MDGDLVRRMAGGDRAAFDEFYAKASGPVFQVALAVLGDRAEAEDVAQDAFVQLWRDASRFDPTRGSPLAWAISVARSRALDRARSSGARRRLADRLAQQIRSAQTSGATQNESMRPEVSGERNNPGPPPAGLRQALEQLPAEQRQVVELAYFTGMSQTEMAERLGIPLGTVKTRVKLAMEKLRALLPHE